MEDTKPQEVKLAEAELKIVLQTLKLFSDRVQFNLALLHNADVDLQDDKALLKIYAHLHDAIPESL
ncbi:hypothetical protein J8M01_06890 [Pseudoalteromonas sp. MMG005]|nr:hypothetical protein [Pseudoalteromonas sp. MMG005]